MKRILLLFAHPALQRSRINAKLIVGLTTAVFFGVAIAFGLPAGAAVAVG